MARYKGKNVQLKIGNATLCVKSYNFKSHTDGLDVTDTCSNGFRETEDGLRQADGKFEADWKAAEHPFGSGAPGIEDGMTVAISMFAKNDEAAIFSGNVFIEDVEVTTDVAGTVSYSVTWKSTGEYSLAADAT